MKQSIKKTGITIFLLTVIQTILSAQAPLPLDNLVHYGKLDNGFTYYIRENHEPQKRAVLYLVCKAGSILETDDQQGLAHFMEHMSFNGTTHFPKNTLIGYLQKSGVRFGADLNAYTSFDETIYQLPIPTDDPELFKNGMQIMRDWAGEATLDPEEIDKERGVVLEEMRLRKGAGQRLRDQYLPVLLNHSRYADRIPIGKKEILENFNPETIRRFYTDWYRPGLQALIVVGDVNVDEVEHMVRDMFSGLETPASAPQRMEYTIPLTGKNQFLAITDKEVSQPNIMIAIKHPGFIPESEEDFREAVVRQLFNRMLSTRLSELSKQPGTAFLGVKAGISSFLGGLDLFSVQVEAKPKKFRDGFSSVWGEITRIKHDGFTPGELERAKQNYLSSFEKMIREKDKRGSDNFAREYQRHFLQGEASPGIEKEYDMVNKFTGIIRLPEINAFVNECIKNTDRDVVVMAPESMKDSLPGEAELTSWMSSVENSTPAAYVDPAEGISLMDKQPLPGKITREKTVPELGVTLLTLSNGAEILLKPTDFKNNEILFTAYSPGGTSLYSDNEFQSVANAAGILAACGLGKADAVQLPQLLSGKQVSVRPFIGENSEGLSGSSTTGDLETALQLAHLYFTAPRKDTAIFSNIISRSEAAISGRYSDPKNVFADTISAVLGSYSPRRTGPTLKKLETIDLDACHRYYKERFANAGDFTFLFVGSFQPDSIRPLLEKYLGSLPSGGRKETIKDLGIHIPEGKIKKTVYKGSEDKATVRLVFSGEYDFTPANNLRLEALAKILQFRLLERLREKEGGVYTPGVQYAKVKYPDSRYACYLSFGCDPQNVDRLIDATLEEIRKLQAEGPVEEDLVKFVNEEKRQEEIHLRSNPFWLSYLSSQVQNDEDLGELLSHDALLERLSAVDIQKSADRLLDENNLIRFELLPEEENAKTQPGASTD